MPKMTVEKTECGIVLLRIDDAYHVVKYHIRDDMVSQVWLGDQYNKGIVESRKGLTVENVRAITKPRKYITTYEYYKEFVKQIRNTKIERAKAKITQRIEERA